MPTTVSIDLSDFIKLLEAAEFGIRKAESIKSDFTIRAWKEAHERLSDMPLIDHRTQQQRDAAFLDGFAADCAKHGCD